MKLRTKPHKYQVEGVAGIWKFKGSALLADDMGLGKTLQWLMFFAETHRSPGLVICPAHLKWNWEREAWTHFGLRSHVLEGQTIPKKFYLKHPLVIINYDILKFWLPVLAEINPRVVAIDECHKIANRSAQRTKLTRLLASRAKFRVCLSGTPLLNRPAELWTSLNLVCPAEFPSFRAFAERYCKPERKPWGMQYKGAENLSELRRKLRRTCMIRRRKADVLKDLPAQGRSIVPLEIKNRKEYVAAQKDFIGWLTKQSAGLAKKAIKAQQVVKQGYLLRLIARLKVPSVIEWIDNYQSESDEKLIVFGHHRSVLGELVKRYGSKCVLINGSVTGQARQRVVDRFNKDKRIKLLFANTTAANSGWSCTSTSTTAFCEFEWTSGEHLQAEARTHGLGRGRKGVRSHSYYLVGRDTIEDLLCKLLQKKQRDLEETLDGIGKGDSLDLHDELTRLLLEKVRA